MSLPPKVALYMSTGVNKGIARVEHVVAKLLAMVPKIPDPIIFVRDKDVDVVLRIGIAVSQVIGIGEVALTLSKILERVHKFLKKNGIDSKETINAHLTYIHNEMTAAKPIQVAESPNLPALPCKSPKSLSYKPRVVPDSVPALPYKNEVDLTGPDPVFLALSYKNEVDLTGPESAPLALPYKNETGPKSGPLALPYKNGESKSPVADKSQKSQKRKRKRDPDSDSDSVISID